MGSLGSLGGSMDPLGGPMGLGPQGPPKLPPRILSPSCFIDTRPGPAWPGWPGTGKVTGNSSFPVFGEAPDPLETRSYCIGVS